MPLAAHANAVFLPGAAVAEVAAAAGAHPIGAAVVLAGLLANALTQHLLNLLGGAVGALVLLSVHGFRAARVGQPLVKFRRDLGHFRNAFKML